MNNKLLALSILGTLTLGGCANNLAGSDYNANQTRSVQQVQTGVVTNVRQVMIRDNNEPPVGALAGAAAGGIAGSHVGGGNGQIVGAVLGAVLGGVGGNAVQNQVTTQKGLEITVRLDSGRTIAVTQAANEQFYVGDSVRILSDNGVTRISH